MTIVRQAGISAAWLGAGAIALGVGGVLGTSAAAFADAGQGSSASTSEHASTTVAGPSKGRAATGQLRPRTNSTRTKVTVAGVGGGDRLGDGNDASAAQFARSGPKLTGSLAAVSDSVADVGTQSEPQVPGYGTVSYLPGPVPVPGSAVEAALQQISATRDILHAQTWGAGNVLAGLVSLVPQMFLTQAASSLSMWQNSIEQAKQAVANTVDVPIAHQVAQLSLLGTLLLPTFANIALDGAVASIPWVGMLGAPTTASEALELTQNAQQNSQVYAVRLMRTVATTQQIVYVSVNGSAMLPVLLDTGSSGLSIVGRYVPTAGLGEPTGTGESGYGNDSVSVRYSYTKYRTTIDFGGGAISSPGDVMIVDPSSESIYENYAVASLGLAGTLGIAANSGSGPTLTALLPGELKDGILMYQNIIGPWGFVVFGPNPLPSRVSVPGGPIGDQQVQVNDGPLNPIRINVDSGGVRGGLPRSVVGGAAQGNALIPGTRLTFYTADGQTVLYSYVVTSTTSPVVYDDSQPTATRPNSGNMPFQLGPIYLDYSTPGGLGTTHFDII